VAPLLRDLIPCRQAAGRAIAPVSRPRSSPTRRGNVWPKRLAPNVVGRTADASRRNNAMDKEMPMDALSLLKEDHDKVKKLEEDAGSGSRG
jgi:hypothetical protein